MTDFVDYYAVLNLQGPTGSSEIKAAYRTQAKKWHPDKNPGVDTTDRMQLICEAYTILNDEEARHQYDEVYISFKSQSDTKQKVNTSEAKETFTYSFDFNNESLKSWMRNAREQSFEYAKTAIREFGEMAGTGAQVFFSTFASRIPGYIVFSLFFFIILKACN